MQSKYNKLKHCLVEQPEMNRPADYINSTNSFDIEKWNKEWREYNKQLSSMRSIPCQPGTIWEEDRIYEEGVDYKVYWDEYFNLCGQLYAIPIQKEDDLTQDDLWKELLGRMGIRDHGEITLKKGVDQIVELFSKHYTITKKTV